MLYIPVTFHDVLNKAWPFISPSAMHLASSKETVKFLLERLKSPPQTTFMSIYLYFCFSEYTTVNVFMLYRDKPPCWEKFQGILSGLGFQGTSPPFGKTFREVFKLSLSANSFELNSRTIVMWAQHSTYPHTLMLKASRHFILKARGCSVFYPAPCLTIHKTRFTVDIISWVEKYFKDYDT
jgi:hypothetical protein